MTKEEIERNFLEIKSLKELSKVEKPKNNSEVHLVDPPDFQINKFKLNFLNIFKTNKF